VTIISPKIREAIERMTAAELQGVVADAESWTPPAIEAAREELQRRGVGEKPSWAEWLARWPGRAAFAEADDAPEAAEGGEKPLDHYLEAVESRCLYCGVREPLQFHPFVVSAHPSEELSRFVAAGAVRMVGRSFGIAGGLVSGLLGWTILNEGRARESLLLYFVLCDDCAPEAVSEKNEFPPEVYALHPWVDPLMQVGYEVMVRDPDHSTIVQAAKRLKSPPSAVGIRMV
jgi:hypothetical protein